MSWLDDVTDSRDMSLSKLPEIVKDRGAWRTAVPSRGCKQQNTTQRLNNNYLLFKPTVHLEFIFCVCYKVGVVFFFLTWTSSRFSSIYDLSHKLKVTQSCPTLFDPMDCSLPGSFVHRILQAGILQWVAILFSRGSSQLRD